MVIAVPAQTVWSSVPLVSAKVEIGFTVITTSSLLLAQGEFDIVQRKVAEAPTTNPVTPEVGEVRLVTVAVPDTTDQAPVPMKGVLPARVVVVTLHKT